MCASYLDFLEDNDVCVGGRSLDEGFFQFFFGVDPKIIIVGPLYYTNNFDFVYEDVTVICNGGNWTYPNNIDQLKSLVARPPYWTKIGTWYNVSDHFLSDVETTLSPSSMVSLGYL